MTLHTELPGIGRVAYASKVDLDLLANEFVYGPHPYLRHGVTLAEGACVFDVGANIGIFARSLSLHIKRGRVFAFEPLPETFALLEQNAVGVEGLEVRLFSCGLGAYEDTVTFSYFPRTTVLSTMRPDHSGQFARDGRRYILEQIATLSPFLRVLKIVPGWLLYPITESIRRYYHAVEHVPCRLRTISSIIDECGIDRIDLLKIDTEGAEQEVLAGLRPEHWDVIRQMVVEVHDGPSGVYRLETTLRTKGFTTVSEPVFAHADRPHLVFATRPRE